jgi:hypothetical protein
MGMIANTFLAATILGGMTGAAEAKDALKCAFGFPYEQTTQKDLAYKVSRNPAAAVITFSPLSPAEIERKRSERGPVKTNGSFVLVLAATTFGYPRYDDPNHNVTGIVGSSVDARELKERYDIENIRAALRTAGIPGCRVVQLR